MKKIKIITDSASDISIEQEKDLEIEVLPFKIAMGNDSYTSRIDFDNEQFYKMMEEYEGIPTTSQVTPYEFEKLYNKYSKEGYTDIVLVLINAKGSATYNNSVMAREQFFEEYPELEGKFNIHLFDGKSYNAGYGLAVLGAAKMVKEGKDIEDVLDYINEELSKKCIYFGMYTLTYAVKSGRIPSAAAFVGETIGLKPVMKIWDHEIITASKVRGEKKLMTNIINMMAEDMEDNSPYSVIYGSDKEVADELAKKLTEKLGYEPKEYFQIGAAIAINAGPKVVGVVFDTKERC